MNLNFKFFDCNFFFIKMFILNVKNKYLLLLDVRLKFNFRFGRC